MFYPAGGYPALWMPGLLEAPDADLVTTTFQVRRTVLGTLALRRAVADVLPVRTLISDKVER